MSDGTLRALGVLVALFAAGDVYSPIGVEEPEVALHPAAAGLVLEALQTASQLRQVIATSHSPDLLDSPSITSEQVLAVRSEAGNTRIARPDAAAAESVRDSLYTVGELLRIDQLVPDPEMVLQPGLF